MGTTKGITGAMAIALILIAVSSIILFSVIDFSLMAANREFSLFIVWLVVLAAVHMTSGIAILRGHG